MTNGTVFFICSTSAISALLAAPRIPAWQAAPKRWQRGCRNRRKKKELWQNQNLQLWTCLQLIRQVPHPRKIRMHPEARVNSQLQGNLKAGWEEIRDLTKRRVLKWSWKMKTLVGWWMTARRNLSQQRRGRYCGSSLNLNPVAFTRMKWQVSLLRRQRARWNLRLPVFQKIQGILKLKEGTVHIISTYPLKSCFTWTKSIWLWETLTIEDIRMKWRTSMWTRPFGERLWIPLFKQQFILVRTVIRIYDLLRIISGVLWSFSKKLKNWSRIRQKSMVLPRLISKSTHGARQAYCVTELIRSRMPRPTFYVDSVLCLEG